jgi:hypothetical protein
VRNLLFPLLGKGPVFGGGGGGGGGGGDSGGSSGTLTTTASSKSSGGGDRYTSIRDMFDGGGAGKSGEARLRAARLGGISNSIGAFPLLVLAVAAAATTIEATLLLPLRRPLLRRPRLPARLPVLAKTITTMVG